MSRAVVVVDHGSRLPEANAQLDAVATALRTRLPGTPVYAAHLELVEPRVAAALDAAAADGAREIVLAPWFLGPGSHSTRDLPRLAAEAESRHPGLRVRCAEPLGVDARLVEVLLEKIAAA